MNSNKLNVILNGLKFGLVGIGVIACLLVIGGPNAEAEVPVQEEFRDGGAMSTAIGYTLLIIVAAVAAVLLFFVLQLISTPKKTVMSILGLIIALVLFLIFWMVGTSDTNESLALRDPVELGTIRTVTAGLYTAFVGVIAGVLVWVLSPLMGRMRK